MNEQQAAPPAAPPAAGQGLLARIASRKAEGTMQNEQARQQGATDAAMPDAGESSQNQRRSYGGAIASAPDQNMQEEQAAPEEQAQFTQMEKAMAEVVYGEKANKSIVAAVMKHGDPVDGIGKIAKDLVTSLSKKFPGASDDVLMGLGESAVEQITEVVEAANPNVQLTDDQVAEAYSIAVTAWMESNPGGVSGDMMQYMNEKPPAQL